MYVSRWLLSVVAAALTIVYSQPHALIGHHAFRKMKGGFLAAQLIAT
jgi:hypothetical protein